MPRSVKSRSRACTRARTQAHAHACGHGAPQGTTCAVVDAEPEYTLRQAQIRALLSLGLTADETVPFVECLRAGNERADVCPSSLDAYRLRIAEIDQRIEELSRLRGELSGLLHDAENYPTTPQDQEKR